MNHALPSLYRANLDADTLAARLFHLYGGCRYLQEIAWLLMLELSHLIHPDKGYAIFRAWTKLMLTEMDSTPPFMRRPLPFRRREIHISKKANIAKVWFLFHVEKDLWFGFRNQPKNLYTKDQQLGYKEVKDATAQTFGPRFCYDYDPVTGDALYDRISRDRSTQGKLSPYLLDQYDSACSMSHSPIVARCALPRENRTPGRRMRVQSEDKRHVASEEGQVTRITYEYGALVSDRTIEFEFDTRDNRRAFYQNRIWDKFQLIITPDVKIEEEEEEEEEIEEIEEEEEEEIKIEEEKYLVTEVGRFSTIDHRGPKVMENISVEFEFDTLDNRWAFYQDRNFAEAPNFWFVPDQMETSLPKADPNRANRQFHLFPADWHHTPPPIKQELATAIRSSAHFSLLQEREPTPRREVVVSLVEKPVQNRNLTPVEDGKSPPAVGTDWFNFGPKGKKYARLTTEPMDEVVRLRREQLVKQSQVKKHQKDAARRASPQYQAEMAQIRKVFFPELGETDPLPWEKKEDCKPELAMKRGTRLETTPEPNEGEDLSSGTIKRCTGGSRPIRKIMEDVELFNSCYSYEGGGTFDEKKYMQLKTQQLRAEGIPCATPAEISTHFAAKTRRAETEPAEWDTLRRSGTGKAISPLAVAGLCEIMSPPQQTGRVALPRTIHASSLSHQTPEKGPF